MSYVQTQPYSVPKGQGVPDGVLVEQALAGDQCAFDILVRRYHRLLVSYIHGFLKDSEKSMMCSNMSSSSSIYPCQYW